MHAGGLHAGGRAGNAAAHYTAATRGGGKRQARAERARRDTTLDLKWHEGEEQCVVRLRAARGAGGREGGESWAGRRQRAIGRRRLAAAELQLRSLDAIGRREEIDGRLEESAAIVQLLCLSAGRSRHGQIPPCCVYIWALLPCTLCTTVQLYHVFVHCCLWLL